MSHFYNSISLVILTISCLSLPSYAFLPAESVVTADKGLSGNTADKVVAFPQDYLLQHYVPQQVLLPYEGSPTLLREFSMTDHIFPGYKKITSTISTGTTRAKSILPGNPFKKWFGKKDDEVEYYEEVPAVLVEKKKDYLIDPKYLAKASSYAMGTLGPKLSSFTQAAMGKAVKKITPAAIAVKTQAKQLITPQSLEASVKLQHPLVGKQFAKIKLEPTSTKATPKAATSALAAQPSVQSAPATMAQSTEVPTLRVYKSTTLPFQSPNHQSVRLAKYQIHV